MATEGSASSDRIMGAKDNGQALNSKELSSIDYKTQALLTTVLGAFGVGDFYAGNYGQGVAKLAVSIVLGAFTPKTAKIGPGAMIAFMSLIQLSQGDYVDGKGKFIRQVVHLKKEEISSCDQKIALILCSYLGWLGAHQFYAGKPLKGVLMLCSGGGFGVWWLMNAYQLATCGFKDSQGKTICPNYIKQAAT